MVFGGDNITEYYASKIGIAKTMMMFNNFAKKGIKVFLLSQSVGPFHSWRVPVSKRLLLDKNIYIYTRDKKSYRYLTKELGFQNVLDCADLAYLDLPKQNEKNEKKILKNYELEKGEYVTLVPSGLWWHYHQDNGCPATFTTPGTPWSLSRFIGHVQ